MPTCRTCGAPLASTSRFCSSCGVSESAHASAVEERKLATVLFADLVGSTAFGEATDPERTRMMLDGFYEAMAVEIERVGGTVEKFVGDAVMAAFGAPVAHEDHAERALAAALSMQERLPALFGEQLKLRIGVNTGEVVVGRPREGSSFVTGDAVNVAAGLEAAAASGEILVGERTVAAAGAAFEYGELREIAVKGKRLPVAAHLLVGALAPRRPRGARGLRSSFIGRERELEALLGVYDDAVRGRSPRLVVVTGDPGAGKSRLVVEFLHRLARRPLPPSTAIGRCVAYGRQTTYAALGDVLRQRLGVPAAAAPEDVAKRLGERRILALALDVAADLHPLVARARFRAAWAKFLAEEAAERPLVVVVEDAHWAQPPLLELLDELVASLEVPLLLLVTARPELSAGVFARAAATTLTVEALHAASAEEMARELLGSDLPASLAPILEAAQGNPFFIEELVASLLDRGLLVRRNGGWAMDEPPPASSSVPDSINALLASRIDLLPPREKRALQAAAVIGRHFRPEAVEALLEEPPDLGLLEERDFALRRPGGPGEGEYLLKHALTREVAYASVPRTRRARMHAAYAGWLEREGGGGDEHAPALAHHYANALDPEFADLAWEADAAAVPRLRAKALAWLRRAAELAVGRYDIDQALSLLQRALELAEGNATRFVLWRLVAAAHALRYDGDGFVSASEHAVGLAPDEQARASTYADLSLRTAVAGLMWNPPLPPAVVEDWIERALAGAPPNSAERAKALVSRAWKDENASEPAREALVIGERLRDTSLTALALRSCVLASAAAGEHDVAAAQDERLRSLIGDISDPGLKEILMTPSVRVAALRGRLDDARRHVELIDGLICELTSHHRLHGLAYTLEVEELAGAWETVAALERRVEEAVDRNRNTPCARNARSLLVCALASAALGRDERARALEAAADGLEMEGHVRALAPLRMRLDLLRGDFGELERTIARYGAPKGTFLFDISGAAVWLDAAVALGLWERVEEEAPRLAQPGTYTEPFALRALGLARNDADLVDRAHDRFAAQGLDWFAEQTKRLGAGRAEAR